MLQLERSKNNPILVPDQTSWWEKRQFLIAEFSMMVRLSICYIEQSANTKIMYQG